MKRLYSDYRTKIKNLHNLYRHRKEFPTKGRFLDSLDLFSTALQTLNLTFGCIVQDITRDKQQFAWEEGRKIIRFIQERFSDHNTVKTRGNPGILVLPDSEFTEVCCRKNNVTSEEANNISAFYISLEDNDIHSGIVYTRESLFDFPTNETEWQTAYLYSISTLSHEILHHYSEGLYHGISRLKPLEEGITQYLAFRIVEEAYKHQYPTLADDLQTSSTYTEYAFFARELEQMVGRSTLEEAFFNGNLHKVAEEFDRKMGTELTFESLLKGEYFQNGYDKQGQSALDILREAQNFKEQQTTPESSAGLEKADVISESSQNQSEINLDHMKAATETFATLLEIRHPSDGVFFGESGIVRVGLDGREKLPDAVAYSESSTVVGATGEVFDPRKGKQTKQMQDAQLLVKTTSGNREYSTRISEDDPYIATEEIQEIAEKAKTVNPVESLRNLGVLLESRGELGIQGNMYLDDRKGGSKSPEEILETKQANCLELTGLYLLAAEQIFADEDIVKIVALDVLNTEQRVEIGHACVGVLIRSDAVSGNQAFETDWEMRNKILEQAGVEDATNLKLLVIDPVNRKFDYRFARVVHLDKRKFLSCFFSNSGAYASNRKEQSDAYYRRAKELWPGNPNACIHFATKEGTTAEKAREIIMETDPDYAQSYTFTLLYAFSEDVGFERGAIKTSLELNPNNPEALEAETNFLIGEWRFDEAEKSSKRMIEILKTKIRDTWKASTHVCATTRDSAKARAEVENYKMRLERAYFITGQLLFLQGKFMESSAMCDSALSLGRKTRENILLHKTFSLLGQAVCFKELDKLERARKLIASLSEEHGIVILAQAAVAFLDGEQRKGKKLLRRFTRHKETPEKAVFDELFSEAKGTSDAEKCVLAFMRCTIAADTENLIMSYDNILDSKPQRIKTSKGGVSVPYSPNAALITARRGLKRKTSCLQKVCAISSFRLSQQERAALAGLVTILNPQFSDILPRLVALHYFYVATETQAGFHRGDYAPARIVDKLGEIEQLKEKLEGDKWEKWKYGKAPKPVFGGHLSTFRKTGTGIVEMAVRKVLGEEGVNEGVQRLQEILIDEPEKLVGSHFLRFVTEHCCFRYPRKQIAALALQYFSDKGVEPTMERIMDFVEYHEDSVSKVARILHHLGNVNTHAYSLHSTVY